MRDLGKLIVAKGFKKLSKVQKIAQSGHTAHHQHSINLRRKTSLGSGPDCSFSIYTVRLLIKIQVEFYFVSYLNVSLECHLNTTHVT